MDANADPTINPAKQGGKFPTFAARVGVVDIFFLREEKSQVSFELEKALIFC